MSEFLNREEIMKALDSPEENPNAAGPALYYNYIRPYRDTGEGHILAIGRTGGGKSQYLVAPFLRNIIMAGESMIVLDPKGEHYRRFKALLEEKGYEVRKLDFRNPDKSDTYNPLYYPAKLIKYGDSTSRTDGEQMLSMIGRTLYPPEKSTDPIWPNDARAEFRGLFDILLKKADCDDVTFTNISRLDSDLMRVFGTNMALLNGFGRGLELFDSTQKGKMKEYIFEFVGENCKAELLKSIDTTDVTSQGISSTMQASLEDFVQSPSIVSMMSGHEFDISELGANEKPLAVFIIVPDENRAYDAIAAMAVQQMIVRFFRLADACGGPLKRRVNFVLEETGNITGALPDLPRYISTARSRNIRFTLVLQSFGQLVASYGKGSADTVINGAGTWICFGANDEETMKQIMPRLGYRSEGRMLLTPDELAEMKVGRALVVLGDKGKYVTDLKPYYRLYPDEEEWEDTDEVRIRETREPFRIYEAMLADKDIRAMVEDDYYGRHNSPGPAFLYQENRPNRKKNKREDSDKHNHNDGNRDKRNHDDDEDVPF